MSRIAVLFALTLAGCPRPTAPVAATGCAERSVTLLHLNDVYRIEGLLDGRGGLARARTLRQALSTCGPVIVTHAGDAFYPSLPSKLYDGEQMVDVLNALDGDPGGFDPYMVMTFGNHELEKTRWKHAPLVDRNVKASQFTWLDTNLTWATSPEGHPAVEAPHLVQEHLIEANGLKIGFFSLLLDSVKPEYVAGFDTDHLAVARARSASLRAQGADAVIALTHLDVRQDLALLALGAEGPDLVLGGHDHASMTHTVGGRWVLKGAADATEVRVVQLAVARDGLVSVTHDGAGTPLGPDQPPADPAVQAKVDAWLTRFEADYCKEKPGCLAESLTTAAVPLIAEETTIRKRETNLGDWVADRMREPFPEADLAFVNSGSLRLNQDVSAGTAITSQLVSELLPYPADLQLIALTGAELQRVLARSAHDWTASGHWLQVSGLVFRHDVDSGAISDLHRLTPEGPKPIAPEDSLKAVTVRFLLDPAIGNQDGYGEILGLDRVIEHASNGAALEPLVRAGLSAAGEAGFAPQQEGRICQSDRPEAPCLLP